MRVMKTGLSRMSFTAVILVATAIAASAQTFTTLLTFDLADGVDPSGSLIQSANGNLYGTTYSGGTSGNCGPDGCGTIFEITPQGRLKTLHSFDATDGCSSPEAAQIYGVGWISSVAQPPARNLVIVYRRLHEDRKSNSERT